MVEFAAPTDDKDSRIISALAGLYQQAGVQGAADGRAARLRGGNEEREKKKILERRSVCRDPFNWEMFMGSSDVVC